MQKSFVTESLMSTLNFALGLNDGDVPEEILEDN